MQRHTRDDSGASLILVIVLVTVFGVVTAALLSFSSTGFKITNDVNASRDAELDADAAMQGAINALREQAPAGQFEKIKDPAHPAGAQPPCPTAGNQYPVFEYHSDSHSSYSNAGTNVFRVWCHPQKDTGTTVDPGAPDQTLLAVSGRDCEGITVESTGNDHPNSLVIAGGGVISNSRIAIGDWLQGDHCGGLSNDATLIVDAGDVSAAGHCSPTPPADHNITVNSGFHIFCDTGVKTATPPYPAVGSSYAHDTLSDLKQANNFYTGTSYSTVDQTVNPKPTCVSGRYLKWVPGIYTERLEDAYFNSASCSTVNWWFSPGLYYIDYPTTTAASSYWDVLGDPNTGVNVVGGTLANPANITFPDACVKSQPGVEFIIGGQTRMLIQKTNTKTGGAFELCGGPIAPGTSQRIALYGYPCQSPYSDGTCDAASGRVDRTPVEDARNVCVTSAGSCTAVIDSPAPSAPGAAYSPATLNQLTLADGQNAVAHLSGDAATSASVQIQNIKVPAGSYIKNLYVDAWHQESVPNGASGTISVTMNNADGTSRSCASKSVAKQSTMHAELMDLTSCLAPSFAYANVNSLTVTWQMSATLAPSHDECKGKSCTHVNAETGDVLLDQLAARVNYTPPGFETTRCATTDSNNRACAPLTFDAESTNAGHGNTQYPIARIHGTVFAPASKIQFTVRGSQGQNSFDGSQSFDRGIIARWIHLKISKTADITQEVFDLDKNQVPPYRKVLLEAQCVSGPACPNAGSSPGAPRVRALVKYHDPPYTGYSGQTVTITVLRWTNLDCDSATSSGRCAPVT